MTADEKHTPPTTGQEREIIYVPSQFGPQDDEDEIDLLELWSILWHGRWFVAGVTFLATFAAVLITLFVLPVTYQSSAVLQPTDTSGGGAASKLAGLAAPPPIPVSLPGGGGKSQSIVTFLKSRKLKQRLIQEYDLLPRLYPEKWNEKTQSWKVEDPSEKPTLVKALQSNALDGIYAVSQDDESGLISINWVDEDPQFAARMLGRIIDETKFFLENEYETDAQREREFVEDQLAKAKKDLEHWSRQVPTQKITLAEIQRERTAAQTVYTELRKQLELAKISEAKEIVRFKVLDPPFVPEEKYKPKRSLICALTLVTSGFLGVFLVFFRQFVVNVQARQSEGQPHKPRSRVGRILLAQEWGFVRQLASVVLFCVAAAVPAALYVYKGIIISLVKELFV